MGSRRSMNQDLLSALEFQRRRPQTKIDWKGARGGEKVSFLSLELSFKKRKILPHNPKRM
jgi:hypothetical protein